jgi:hypothetical protein
MRLISKCMDIMEATLVTVGRYVISSVPGPNAISLPSSDYHGNCSS